MGAHRGEPRLVDVLTHHARHLRLFAFAGGERAAPIPKGPVAVGDRQQAYMGNVVEKRNRGVDQTIAERLLEIGQGQQAFAQFRAIAQEEMPYAADFVGTLVAFDRTLADCGMPTIVAIEIAQKRPNPVGRVRR